MSERIPPRGTRGQKPRGAPGPSGNGGATTVTGDAVIAERAARERASRSPRRRASAGASSVERSVSASNVRPSAVHTRQRGPGPASGPAMAAAGEDVSTRQPGRAFKAV